MTEKQLQYLHDPPVEWLPLLDAARKLGLSWRAAADLFMSGYPQRAGFEDATVTRTPSQILARKDVVDFLAAIPIATHWRLPVLNIKVHAATPDGQGWHSSMYGAQEDAVLLTGHRLRQPASLKGVMLLTSIAGFPIRAGKIVTVKDLGGGTARFTIDTTFPLADQWSRERMPPRVGGGQATYLPITPPPADLGG